MAVAVVAAVLVLRTLGAGGGSGTDGPGTSTSTTADRGGPTSTTAVVRQASGRPLLPGSVARLALVHDRGLVVLGLGNGTALEVDFPDPLGRVSRPPVVLPNGHVVVVQRAVAWGLGIGGLGPPRVLGPADDVLPGGPAFVWLVDQRRDTVTHVSGDGTSSLTTVVEIPDRMWAAPLDDGFVATSHERWIRYDGDGRLVDDRAGLVIASGGSTVVWLERLCREPTCTVHVTDVDTGRDRTLELAADPFPAIHEAHVIERPPAVVLGGDLSGDRAAYEILLVGLHDEELQVDAAATALDTPPGTIGAADGWLFWTRRRFGGTDTLFSAYHPGDGRMLDLDLPVRSVVTFAAL